MIDQKDIGKRVTDRAGNIGILRAVIMDYADPASLAWQRKEVPTAFVWDEQTAREWLAPPGKLERM
ncbi:hypothetical protein OG897_20890 [Streptomyces sp. NBC_00237]|uniref:hypothetical protein n=1 Tax=Streptomyces sp. NBC_00237 TaxID=2975687 RepID=UPI00225965CC|nr:hypothetical protein [Streptomyces sp. NBC_00237]MCX5203901.1 hypothetical protein [Streptomyces sp. NBC_00237]